ncbi:terpene synthase family protein [Pseudomonas nunensis]|uniref:terpene synthase family protein n=1 Tax=Pseudomonas nunensis TaxID=2961896 RepID=UPI0006B4DCA2|nr:hypothetical protein [Pseudomonas nunensis]KOX99312.1 hypothetical protein AM274_26315 [Pseudomonas nunensis]
MNQIILPALANPFPYSIHPSIDADNPDKCRIELTTRDYADRFKLYWTDTQRERLKSIGCARVAALMYPGGSDELLQIGADFVLWAFAYDDEYCDEGPMSLNPVAFISNAAEIQRAAESPEHAAFNDRYALAMRDLRCRLDKYATPTQVGRFVEGVRSYMLIEMWKAVVPHPSLNEYMVMRMYGGGGWAFPILNHIVAGIDITQDEYEDRRVRALTEMMVSLMVWDTESYGYVKECARAVDEKEHNLIRILCRDYKYSFEQSIQHYLEMRRRLISLFFRLRTAVFVHASPAVRSYINGLTDYYSGAVVWTQTNSRYGSISGTSRTGAFEGGELTQEVPAESFESVGLPSCEWWWEYDPARQSNQPDKPPTAER